MKIKLIVLDGNTVLEEVMLDEKVSSARLENYPNKVDIRFERERHEHKITVKNKEKTVKHPIYVFTEGKEFTSSSIRIITFDANLNHIGVVFNTDVVYVYIDCNVVDLMALLHAPSTNACWRDIRKRSHEFKISPVETYIKKYEV